MLPSYRADNPAVVDITFTYAERKKLLVGLLWLQEHPEHVEYHAERQLGALSVALTNEQAVVQNVADSERGSRVVEGLLQPTLLALSTALTELALTENTTTTTTTTQASFAHSLCDVAKQLTFPPGVGLSDEYIKSSVEQFASTIPDTLEGEL